MALKSEKHNLVTKRLFLIAIAVYGIFLVFYINEQINKSSSNVITNPKINVESTLSPITTELQQPAGPDLIPLVNKPHLIQVTPDLRDNNAKALVLHFYRAYDYAMATGDTSVLKEISDPSCIMCNEIRENISKYHKPRQNTACGQTKDIELSTVDQNNQILVKAQYLQSPIVIKNIDGDVMFNRDASLTTTTWVVKVESGKLMLMAGVDNPKG